MELFLRECAGDASDIQLEVDLLYALKADDSKNKCLPRSTEADPTEKELLKRVLTTLKAHETSKRPLSQEGETCDLRLARRMVRHLDRLRPRTNSKSILDTMESTYQASEQRVFDEKLLRIREAVEKLRRDSKESEWSWFCAHVLEIGNLLSFLVNGPSERLRSNNVPSGMSPVAWFADSILSAMENWRVVDSEEACSLFATLSSALVSEYEAGKVTLDEIESLAGRMTKFTSEPIYPPEEWEPSKGYCTGHLDRRRYIFFTFLTSRLSKRLLGVAPAGYYNIVGRLPR